MMLRLERASGSGGEVLRIIGNLRIDELDALRLEFRDGHPINALDLTEISLVDVEAVRFLGSCEIEGMSLLQCPAYIREWINRERS
jgi:hypothetical protein